MSKGIDYSKWDNIELSDDEEVPPNIDGPSFRRWRKRQKEEEEEKDQVAEKVFQEHMTTRETNKARLAQVETLLSASDTPALQQELEQLRAKEAEFAREETQHAEKEAIKKKNFKWTADNMCKVKTERTELNKAPDKVPDPSANVDHTQRKVDEKTGKILDVGGDLVERFSEVSMESLKDVERYVITHPELLAKKHSDDLAILAFRALQAKKKKKALNYLQHSFIIRYCQEIGGGSVMQFFKRMYTPEGRRIFDEDVEKTMLTMQQTADEPEPEPKAAAAEEEEEYVPLDPKLKETLESLPEPVANALIANDNDAFRAALEALPDEEAQGVLRKLEEAGLIARKPSAAGDASGGEGPAEPAETS